MTKIVPGTLATQLIRDVPVGASKRAIIRAVRRKLAAGGRDPAMKEWRRKLYCQCLAVHRERGITWEYEG